MTSEAFQRVTDETLQQSHLKFGTTGEAQNFRIKKKWKTQNYGKQQNKLSKKKRNVLASKLRPACERFQIVNNDALQELSSIRSAMKGKDSALSRDRNLAKIKLLCCDLGHRRSAGLEKANASAAGKHTFRWHVTFFLIPNWRVDLRECL